MKYLKNLLLLLIVVIILPIGVSAASDSSGENGGSASIVSPCSPNCAGIQRNKSLAGVRITFVNSEGKVVAASGGKSYDFITYVRSDRTHIKVTMNGYEGDRNKVALASNANFKTIEAVKQSSIPKFSQVIAAYNENILRTDSPHVSTLNTSGNTGGNLDGFNKELDFFLGLTKNGNPYYVQDVNAFIMAIATVTGGYNASDLIYEVAQGCSEGEEIFIVMEPIFLWSENVNGEWKTNYFGTLADSYYLFGGEVIPNSYHLTNMAYLIYYEREISAFNGVTGVSNREFAIQTGADLLSTAGYGIAVDWANDPGLYCGSCTFVNGQFSYNDQLYSNDNFPSSFDSLQHFAYADRSSGGAGCCDIIYGQLDNLPAEWRTAYNTYCDNDKKDCCSPRVPTIPQTIDVNNCCTDDTTSKIEEVLLDDLFCYSEDLKVDYYFPKCDADHYIDKNAKLNDYCEMYCTERVSIDVPGAITAESGRYFTLTKTRYGTTSPYVEGYKRCRIRTYYDKWLEKYVEKVQEEVNYYNAYQKAKAEEMMYASALENETDVSGKINIKVTCSTTINEPIPNCNGDNCTRPKTTCTDTVEKEFNYSYKKYEFKDFYYYYTVRIKESSKNNYSAIEIESASSGRTSHARYSAYNLADEITSANQAVENAKNECGCETINSATRDKLPDEDNTEMVRESVSSKKDEYATEAQKQENNYKAAAGAAEQLEKDLNKCNNYFTTTDGSAENNYKFNPELKFSYDQVYLDEKSEKALVNTQIDFEKNCTYEVILPENDIDGELSQPNYSEIYGSNPQILTDFANTGLSYAQNSSSYRNFLDSNYSADKKFTHDAKYHVVCKWDEDDKIIKTLVPTGTAEEITEQQIIKDDENNTLHQYEYKVFITTYSGTYQTYWDLTKIGDSGRFDKYILGAGKSCGGQSPEDTASITCTLETKNRIIMLPDCYGNYGTEVTTDPDACPDPKSGQSVYVFKVVEPTDFFPAGTTDSNGESYAYNWVVDEKGKQVMAEINEKGKNSSTYAPENISYSFTLSPTDMKHIKEYNTEKNSEGGYSDFNLKCDCPTEIQTNSAANGVGCTKCKSEFLTNLENGKVFYKSVSHKVNVWSSNSTIESVRNSNNW